MFVPQGGHTIHDSSALLKNCVTALVLFIDDTSKDVDEIKRIICIGSEQINKRIDLVVDDTYVRIK